MTHDTGAVAPTAGAMHIDCVAAGLSSNLDVLRTIAVALVVLSHLPLANFSAFAFIPFHKQAFGIFGVYIFFVHTCLVLMGSLERQQLESPASGLFTPFMVRRIFRIYPLSTLTVLVVFFAGNSASTGALRSDELVSNLLLIQNLTGEASNPAALWSLPFEMQMYLVLPALYVVSRRSKRAVQLLCVMWVVVVGVIFAARAANLNYHLIKYLPCFLPGVIAFAMRPGRAVVPAWSFFVSILVCALLFAISVAVGAPETPIAWFFCLGLGLLLPFVRKPQSRLLVSVSKTAAKYSYSIYLLHGPVIWLAFERYTDIFWPLQVAAFVLVMLVGCWAAYRFIEEPALKLGVALTKNSSIR